MPKKTATKKPTAPSVELDPSVAGGYAGLKLSGIPAEAGLLVEVVYPTRTVAYDQGTDHEGVLDLRFPVIESGEVLVRVLDVSDPDERKLLGSARFEA